MGIYDDTIYFNLGSQTPQTSIRLTCDQSKFRSITLNQFKEMVEGQGQ